MAEEQDKKEEQYDFTPEGEALGYISLDQARVLAMRIARENPGDYGGRFKGVPMAFEVVEDEDTEDHYVITLSFRPQGQFIGAPGQEQFFIEKEGNVAHRQVMALPRPRRHYPVIPVAIGLAVAGVVVAIILLAVEEFGPEDDSQPGFASSLPTATPIPATQTPIPAPTKAPVVRPLVAATSTSTPRGQSIAPESLKFSWPTLQAGERLAFEETFDSRDVGLLRGEVFASNVSVGEEDGNKFGHYRGSEDGWGVLRAGPDPSTLTDYQLRLRVRLPEPSSEALFVYMRDTFPTRDTNDRYSLFLMQQRLEMGLDHWDGGTNSYSMLQGGPFNIETGIWHRVIVSVVGDRITVVLDGLLVFDITDRTLSSGNTGLDIHGPWQVDDIQVIDIAESTSRGATRSIATSNPTPTPMPTPSPTPTVKPLPTPTPLPTPI